MAIWLTTSQVAHFEKVTDRTVRRWVTLGQYIYRIEIDRGVKRYFISSDSLSKAAKEEFIRFQNLNKHANSLKAPRFKKNSKKNCCKDCGKELVGFEKNWGWKICFECGCKYFKEFLNHIYG